MRAQTSQQSGFTLVEMIVVIVITGIIGGMVAMFIRAPVQGYVDSSNRAEMGDIADTALRRLSRDIRTAVPNSIRIANCGATPCVEFLPTRTGGRYRANTPGNILNFDEPDGDFDIVGSPVTFVADDRIVIGSTQSDGNPPYNTGVAGILRNYAGAAGVQTAVTFTATALPVWAELESQRFDVVPGDQQAVTYACLNVGVNGGNGSGTLTRYWGYGFNPVQIMPPVSPTVRLAELADRVSGCEISYDLIGQRNGMVAIRLGITRGGESISLYHTIHVNNVP